MKLLQIGCVKLFRCYFGKGTNLVLKMHWSRMCTVSKTNHITKVRQLCDINIKSCILLQSNAIVWHQIIHFTKVRHLQHQTMRITKVRQWYDTKSCVLLKLGNCLTKVRHFTTPNHACVGIVAQWIKELTCNPKVAVSNPATLIPKPCCDQHVVFLSKAL